MDNTLTPSPAITAVIADMRTSHRDFIFKGLKLIYPTIDESRVKALSDIIDEIYDKGFDTNDDEKVNAYNVRLNEVLESFNDELKLETSEIERTYMLIQDLRTEAIEELNLLYKI